MIYTICTVLLTVGVVGLIAQMAAGFHLGHGHAGGGHGHAGHGHGHAGHTHGHADGQQQAADSHNASAKWLTLLSPLTIFSACIGAGATGLALKSLHVPSELVALAAVGGGLAFYYLVVAPLWSMVFNFASTPSLALEGTVAKDAEVLTPFDTSGKGIVRLTIDGQWVRVLATLEPDDRALAAYISPGDKLTVTSVDGHANTCRVTRL